MGTTISHYNLLERIGSGGMGEVFKAQDTNLDRPVALKFLAPHLVADEETRKRFEREAKAAAALDHPNICTVHEIDSDQGKTFIAMSLIEGESLDQLIARGPLPLDDALGIAQQIARALEAAHKQGITHRDIKPENIMIGPDSASAGNRVTIMDFGLAQLAQASRLTKADQTLGTTAYMSPEQTQGSGTDHRTDIWSLGVVLYEMIVGEQPFKGDYDKAVMYSILNEEPQPITARRTGVPMELEVAVNKALGKDADARYQSAAELAVDLERTASHPRTPAAPRDTQPRSRERLAWGAAVAVLLGALAWAIRSPFNQPELGPSLRLTVPPPGGRLNAITAGAAILSPDGNWLLYTVRSLSGLELWIRNMVNGETELAARGVASFVLPVWSRDSLRYAFTQGSSIRVRNVDSGVEQTFAELPDPQVRGMTWGPGGGLLLGIEALDEVGIWRITEGGDLQPLWPQRARQRIHDYWPVLLDDGERVLFWRRSDRTLRLGSINSEENRILTRADSGAVLIPGWLLFLRDRAMQAQRFDQASGELIGQPAAVADDVWSSYDLAWPNFSASHHGVLAYQRTTAGMRLVWHDRSGKRTIDSDVNRQYPVGAPRVFAISPDGSQIAATVSGTTGGARVWILDSADPSRGQLFSLADSGHEMQISWSLDGKRLFYGRDDGAPPQIVESALDRSVTARAFNPDEVARFPMSHSQDHLVFRRGATLWVAPLRGSREPYPLVTGPFTQAFADITEDGRWVAFQSTATGEPEVYVIRHDGKPRAEPSDLGVRVSFDRGINAVWGPPGSNELFYRRRDGMLIAAKLDLSGSSARLLGSEELFPIAGQFDTVDGQNFLVHVSSEATSSSIEIITNWQARAQRTEK